MEENTTPKKKGSAIDLSVLDYVSAVDRNFLCPICHNPFIDPVQIKDCDHSFCRNCLWNTFSNCTTASYICPTCRSSVASANGIVSAPRFVNHVLDELIVKCPHSSQGCDLELTRGQVQDHVRYYCNFAEVACPSNKCNLTLQRHQLSAECLHQFRECQYCCEKMMERELKSHWETICTKRFSTCPHCDNTIIHYHLTQHMLNCDEAIQPCRASTLGCSFTARAKAVQDHEKTCPLSLLWPSMSAMKQSLESHAGMLTLMRGQYLLLEDTMTSIKSTVSHPETSETKQAARPSTGSSCLSTSLNNAALEHTSAAPFDSATHHLLSLHENLREEINRTSTAVSELDAKFSLMLVNENLRLKEELSHTNAVIGSIRAQLQWLTSARLQAQQRNVGQTELRNIGSGPHEKLTDISTINAGTQSRSSSEGSRQDTKL